MKEILLYYNIIKVIFYKNFNSFIFNIKIIVKNKNMSATFLLFLPFIFYLIKIQIFIGFLFFSWFITLYLIVNIILNTEYTISCKEIPLNTSHLLSYVIINLFIFVPKANAFLISYNILEFIKIKKKERNLNQYLIIFFAFLITFIFKISIFLIIGYSFLSLLITSEFVIRFFYCFEWNYQSKKAMYQKILINCFLNNIDSVGEAENKNIIILQNEIIFNIKEKEILINFLSNVKKPELLLKAFHKNDEIIENNKIDNHYNFSISSKYDFKKNISKNLTSSNSIKVGNVENEIKKVENCKDFFKPNFMGQDKFNYLTPPYELNKDNAIINELESNTLIKMQKFSKIVKNSIILDCDEKMLVSNKSNFYKNENNCTVKEYANEFNVGIKNNINDLNNFLEENKNFFENEENLKDLQIVISLITDIKRDIIFDYNNNKISF